MVSLGCRERHLNPVQYMVYLAHREEQRVQERRKESLELQARETCPELDKESLDYLELALGPEQYKGYLESLGSD